MPSSALVPLNPEVRIVLYKRNRTQESLLSAMNLSCESVGHESAGIIRSYSLKWEFPWLSCLDEAPRPFLTLSLLRLSGKSRAVNPSSSPPYRRRGQGRSSHRQAVDLPGQGVAASAGGKPTASAGVPLASAPQQVAPKVIYDSGEIIKDIYGDEDDLSVTGYLSKVNIDFNIRKNVLYLV